MHERVRKGLDVVRSVVKAQQWEQWYAQREGEIDVERLVDMWTTYQLCQWRSFALTTTGRLVECAHTTRVCEDQWVDEWCWGWMVRVHSTWRSRDGDSLKVHVGASSTCVLWPLPTMSLSQLSIYFYHQFIFSVPSLPLSSYFSFPTLLSSSFLCTCFLVLPPLPRGQVQWLPSLKPHPLTQSHGHKPHTPPRQKGLEGRRREGRGEGPGAVIRRIQEQRSWGPCASVVAWAKFKHRLQLLISFIEL